MKIENEENTYFRLVIQGYDDTNTMIICIEETDDWETKLSHKECWNFIRSLQETLGIDTYVYSLHNEPYY